jgi:hypothetical protein
VQQFSFEEYFFPDLSESSLARSSSAMNGSTGSLPKSFPADREEIENFSGSFPPRKRSIPLGKR